MNYSKKYPIKRLIPSWMIVALIMLSLFLVSGTNDKEVKTGQVQSNRTAKKYSWESPQANATHKGDLEWTPSPFVLKIGKSVRYIDFENGNDNNDGKTKSTPWKHHPGDMKASGLSASSKGVHTYIFKKGSIYRGSINVRESGEEGNSVRLTSDPNWGEGEAMIYGSVRINSGWKKGADNKDIPSQSNVWYRDLDFSLLIRQQGPLKF